MKAKPPRTTTYTLELTPTRPGDGTAELRQALKVLLRRFGLRCLSIKTTEPNEP